MKTISKIELQPTALPRKKRVDAYARVSRETDRLLHSISEQVSYYNELIQKNPEWIFAGVFADSGITGTQISCRSEFQRLMQECENGSVDLILCKSISRFARNTVDLLETIRHLKDIGVEVRFEKEQISTFSGDGEFMLSILASFAQEESRSISENVKWGKRKRFQAGTTGTANKHILGYKFDDEQDCYVIIPEEAESIRWMFWMFLEGLSFQKIADNMNHAGIRTTNGAARISFHRQNSLRDLRRSLFQKGESSKKSHIYPMTCRNKLDKKNCKSVDIREDVLIMMIGGEIRVWHKPPKTLKNPKKPKNAIRPPHLFDGMIFCGICGRRFGRAVSTKKKGKPLIWRCRSKCSGHQNCEGVNYHDSEIRDIFCRMFHYNAFNDEIFKNTVSKIIIQKTGSIDFITTGGETVHYETLKLRDNRSSGTCTDAFSGKIRCMQCSKAYSKFTTHEKYTYWYCIGNKNNHFHCSSPKFSDSNLRAITAYVLESDVFSKSEFTALIDHIEALDNGSLQYVFKDGRKITWQKM